MTSSTPSATFDLELNIMMIGALKKSLVLIIEWILQLMKEL